MVHIPDRSRRISSDTPPRFTCSNPASRSTSSEAGSATSVVDTTNRYAELTLRAKAEALRVCELGSGISAASRARAAWKNDKTLLDWLNTL